MTEDEFRTGKMADGTRLMQAADPMKVLHGRGVALLLHMHKMQDMAGMYLQPGDYTDIEGKTFMGDKLGGKSTAFVNDVLYMLDGPEQRAAEAELSFDYVAEAELTLSRQFHGELVAKHQFTVAVNQAIAALAQLDKVKKALFYGRDAGLASKLDGDVGVAPLPGMIALANSMDTADVADYLHGVIGLATEAGELLEGMRDVINGKPLDLVNVKEEVGDGKWYMAILARVARFMWGEDERTNIAKLRARFPDRFTEYDANNRNLVAERAILEK